MRFDVEALKQTVAAKFSASPASLIAAGGVALAAVVVVYGALLGSGEIPEDAVLVAGPVFTPINATTPAPVPAERGFFTQPGPRAGSAHDDDFAITRKVQRELKRAGCYAGPVNGVWTPATSRAMAAFTSLVNASLPVGGPDPVLLALIETHRDETCSGRSPPQPELARAGPDDAPFAREAPRAAREAAPSSAAREATLEAPAVDADVPPASRGADPTETAALDEGDDAFVGPPEGAAAVAAAAAAASAKTAHADRPPAKRRYRKKNSFSRQVSKGLRQIQRSLNKLF